MRPRKRSLKISGHLTSVSIEDPFWLAFKNIADEKRLSINHLAKDIDVARDARAVTLATAIRIYVLRWYQAKAGEESQGR